jgi:hypothetical protein
MSTFDGDAARHLAALAHWRYDPARLVLVHQHAHAYPSEARPAGGGAVTFGQRGPGAFRWAGPSS